MKPQQNGSDCYESDPFTRSWITSNLVFLASLLRFLYCFFFFFFPTRSCSVRVDTDIYDIDTEREKSGEILEKGRERKTRG